MIGNIKTGKRRAYQDIMQKVFRVEETTSDEEYEKAVRWFRLYEKELYNIVKQVKDYVKGLSTFFLSSSTLFATFNRNVESGEVAIEANEHKNLIGLSEICSKASENNQIVELVTLPAISQFLFDNIQEPINSLLMKEFPVIKKNILFHNGLRKDLESYRRRVRKLQRNGRDVGDKELDKLISKLKSTQVEYNNTHKDLISGIKKLCMEKQKTLDPCFTALSIVQTKFSLDLKTAANFENSHENQINESLKLTKDKLEIRFMDEIEICRRRLDDNKENTATPSGKGTFTFRKLKKKFTPKIGKYKSLSFRGITRTSSLTNHQLTDENPIIAAQEPVVKEAENQFTEPTYFEPLTSPANSAKLVQKRDSAASLFPDETSIAGLEDEDELQAERATLESGKKIIDLNETDDYPYERKLESVEDFSDGDDDEIESYFRN